MSNPVIQMPPAMVAALRELARLPADSQDPVNVTHLLILHTVAGHPGITLLGLLEALGVAKVKRHTWRHRLDLLSSKGVMGRAGLGLLRRRADRHSYLTYRYWLSARGARLYAALALEGGKA